MGKRDAMFDTVMQSVGNNGPFQKRFNYLYNLIFAIVAAMPCMNIILALSVPDHWCHVPGREFTNYTIDEWKNLTLPKEINNKGIEAPSSCKMYNITDASDLHLDYNYSITKCIYGYEYDTRWYELTIPSQEDWVCDKALRVTNMFCGC
ncbi:uncharacterized protein LOC113385953 [Ctenocephalides felis]|uniref:uncharacterized protein LOC113385953 n=1 Tax=Ctenocephalides felis TaxID=7515 RepID=UPI000E6E5B01|nr:uncharacterized protein LOC113385953 [Ctenocephalides felis]